MKYLIIFFCIFSAFMFGGCRHYENYDMGAYEESLAAGHYEQAEERLRRCMHSSNHDKENCIKLNEDLRKYNLPFKDALIKYEAEKNKQDQIVLERYRVDSLRSSESPWDMLILTLEIQAGKIKEAYQGEQFVILEKSFFGFGVCAKENNPECMSQYAKMILLGTEMLPDDKKSEAKKKALYWLNLSARYGNEHARMQLLNIEENIPTPDLAMEILQRDANNLAKRSNAQRLEMARVQEYYNSQMLSEVRLQNFQLALNKFFPKTVSCVSNSSGIFTYTNCQ